MTTLQEKIAVMQAAQEGKPIERRLYSRGDYGAWVAIANPTALAWNWEYEEYRVGKTKHQVFASILRDAGGVHLLGRTHPTLERAQAAGLSGVPIATITWEG